KESPQLSTLTTSTGAGNGPTIRFIFMATNIS
ncbi:unnamed protein product, partial [Oikopleura dioica]